MEKILTPQEEADLKASAMGEKDTPINQTETQTPKIEKPEKAGEKSKELQSALAQKEHFRKKFEDLKSQRGNPETQTGDSKPKSFDPMETVKISKLLNKYTDDESEFILDRAGSSSYDAIKKATEDDWTQLAIQGMRDKVAKEKAIPGSSSPSGGSVSGEISDDTPIKDVERITKERVEKAKREGGRIGI